MLENVSRHGLCHIHQSADMPRLAITPKTILKYLSGDKDERQFTTVANGGNLDIIRCSNRKK